MAEGESKIPGWAQSAMALMMKQMAPEAQQQVADIYKIVAHYAVQLASLQKQNARIIQLLEEQSHDRPRDDERPEPANAGPASGQAVDAAAGNKNANRGGGT